MLKATGVFVLITCFVLTAVARRLPRPYYRVPKLPDRDAIGERPFEDYLQTPDCIPLGGTGCGANHAKCCRGGGKYKGIPRKCENKGEFPNKVYTCVLDKSE